jgi:hypothetical protein
MSNSYLNTLGALDAMVHTLKHAIAFNATWAAIRAIERVADGLWREQGLNNAMYFEDLNSHYPEPEHPGKKV